MKRDTLARWLILLALGATAVAIGIYLPVSHWLQTVIIWVRGLGAPGGLIYGLIYAGGTVLMVPGTLLTAVTGLLYGVLIGVLIVSPASVLGATLAFLVGRYVARDWVVRKLQRYPKFMAIDRAIERNGFLVVLLMRLEPVFLPFALLNYALGITRVRVRDYVLASWLGMLPATILYVYLGSIAGDLVRLLHGDFRHSVLTQWLFWLGLAATALLMLVLVRIGRRALQEQIADAKSAENHRSIGIPPERLNFGCVPSKALIACSRAAHTVRSAADYGITVNDARVDFAGCMQRLRRLRAEISHHDAAPRFRGYGVEVFIGDARFVAPDAVEVGGQKLTFSKAIIAAGARAAELPVPGLQETGYLTNETVWSLTALPALLIIIGAGPIGCELAQAFRRLGSDVTLVTDGAQILPREDADAARVLQSHFEAEGIQVITHARIARAERISTGKAVLFERDGTLQRVVGEEILVAVGRAPNIEGLGLQAAGVEHDASGVKVNQRLCTSNPRIYAAGDICSKYKFTHAAEAMARIALQNALFFGRKRASDLVIPWCTYTDPEIAHVGLYESEARQQGFEIETFTSSLQENDRAIVDGETEGFGRVHIHRKSGKILGATLVGPHAGEIVGEFVLAIQHGIKLQDLSGTIHPYPTVAEIAKRVGDLSMKSRLKPWMKHLLTSFFKMRR